jgi:hypothetical protein
MGESQGALVIILTDQKMVYENYRNLRADPGSGWIVFDYVEPETGQTVTFRYNPAHVVSILSTKAF